MASLEPQPSVDSESEKDFKIVVIGDGAVGKTAMCEVFAKGTFPDKYAPTVFEAYPFDMKYENQVWKQIDCRYGLISKMGINEKPKCCQC